MRALIAALLRGIERLEPWAAAGPRALRRLAVALYETAALLGRWRVAPRLFQAIGAAAILYTLAALALTLALPLASHLWQAETARFFERADQRSRGVALFDVTGAFLGVADRAQEPDVITARGPVPAGGGAVFYPDHKTLSVADAPPDYWACLVWLEDRGLGGWPNPYGVDFTGLMKIPAAAAEATLARGAPARGGGGSTLAMQLARSILKDYPSRSDGLAEVLRRKYWEYTSAPVLTRMLAAGGDWTRFRRWTAMHFAHIQGVDRSDVFGVEAAGRVLFGKGAGALSTAEQYVLAGAIRQPIKFGSAAIWRRAGWGDGRRKGRGRICAEALLEGERRATVLAELEAMAEAGPPAPSASPRIAAYLEGLGKSDAVIGGPELRAARLLRGAQRGALAQARDEFGAFYRRDLEAVTLTLDAVANARFGDRVDRRLARPPAAWRRAIDWGAVTLDFGEARAAAEAAGEGARPALTLLHVVLAAADEDGRIVRFYTNQFDTHYFGAVGKRRPDVVSVAEYQPERETREIASIGKLLAAAALGEAGRDTALSGFDNSCLRARAARCYCGGPPCRDDRAFVQARHVFGESLNDALIAQLTRRGLGARVGELAERAGLTPPPSAADEGVSPATLAVRGRYAATPRTVQRLAAALDGFAHRGDSGRAPTPTLIADAVLRPRAEPGRAPGADAAARPAARPAAAGALAPAGVDLGLSGSAKGRAFARDVLRAPLEPGGTLQGLSRWRPGATTVRSHLVKSGTRGVGGADPAAFDTVDWWIAGAISFSDGRRYSYVALVGSGDPGRPFARDLGSRGAVPLVDMLLADLAGGGGAAAAARPR